MYARVDPIAWLKTTDKAALFDQHSRVGQGGSAFSAEVIESRFFLKRPAFTTIDDN
jgi:hypothetical protein